VLSPRLQEALMAQGVNLPTLVPVDLEHATRGTPQDLRGFAELEIPPGIEFHALAFADVPGRGPGCDVCGYPASARAVQQFVVPSEARIPAGMSMCRVANARNDVLVTAACREAMLACGVPSSFFWPIRSTPGA
jgi:hypothetical protein